MNKNRIITIGRQLGSGGKLIGEKLAEKLDFAFYDKELIQIAAQESGLGKEFFEQVDEKSRFSLLGDFGSWFSSLIDLGQGYPGSYLRNESLFKIQSDVIHDLAKEKPSIFVGRCADYILRNYPNCINIFICADMETRIRRLKEQQKITHEKAIDMIERADKQRAGYYNYYSNKIWGMASSYHFCINSSLLGIEETVSYICSLAVKKWQSD